MSNITNSNDNTTQNIDILSKKAEHIKSELQNLIDKKKSIVSKDSIIEIDNIKKEKIKELESLNKQISELNKVERQRQRKIYNLKSISRAIDTLEYRGAQKRGSYDAMQLAKEAKESRDKARDKYSEYLEYEKEYLKYDPPELPGFLFLCEEAIEKYGICPYIKIDIKPDTLDQLKNIVKQNREMWLKAQSDNGKIIYDLCDKVIYKTELQKLKKESLIVDNQINNVIEKTLPTHLLDTWNKSKTFIEDYTNAPIKTKKIKELFKSFINDISVIFSQTGLPIHLYFTHKYKNVLFHVNEIKTEAVSFDDFAINNLNMLIDNYKQSLDNIQQTNKFITNTLQNLKNELYMFLTEQKKYNNAIQNINIKQNGKYFKKWTTLTEEEKFERFQSFVEYYIEKYMICAGILKQEDKEETIRKVYNLITDAYKNKTLVYRDFKWVSTHGTIDSIKILKYNKEKSEFYLLKKTENVTDTSTTISVKKNTQKSCITKENDKTLNEEILMFLMTVDKNKSQLEIKNKCLEHVKEKLNIKKLNNKDKELIYERFASIYKVVNTNTNLKHSSKLSK